MRRRIWMRIFAALVLALGVWGLSRIGSEGQAAPQVRQLTLATSLPEKIIEPLILEFENRTGIWVDIHSGTAMEMVKLAREGQCDLLLGLGADTLEANRELFRGIDPIVPQADWVPRGSNWVCVFSVRPVIIYNRNLVQNNPPATLDSLMDSQWRAQIAFADPGQCDFAAMILNILCGDSQAELPERMRHFTNNISTLKPKTRDTLDDVLKGNACLAVVNTQMLTDIPTGALGLVFPPDTMVFPEAAAIPLDAKNADCALELVEFLLDPDVQAYAARYFDGLSVLPRDADEAPPMVYDSRGAGQHLWIVLETWKTVWEGAQ